MQFVELISSAFNLFPSIIKGDEYLLSYTLILYLYISTVGILFSVENPAIFVCNNIFFCKYSSKEHLPLGFIEKDIIGRFKIIFSI